MQIMSSQVRISKFMCILVCEDIVANSADHTEKVQSVLCCWVFPFHAYCKVFDHINIGTMFMIH